MEFIPDLVTALLGGGGLLAVFRLVWERWVARRDAAVDEGRTIR